MESVERIHRETADLQQSDLEIATLTTRHPDDEAKQVREGKFGESLKLGMEEVRRYFSRENGALDIDQPEYEPYNIILIHVRGQ